MKSIVFFALGISALGCTSIVDVERFSLTTKKDPTTLSAGSPFSDLSFNLKAMKPHLAHRFEYRVVDANNFVQSRGVIDGLAAEDVVLHVTKAIPKLGGPYHLDFFADVNSSGGFDGLGSVVTNDHAWRIDPLNDYPENTFAHVEGMTQVVFVHSTNFTNIDQYPSGTPNKAKDTELPVTLDFTGIASHLGQMLEVRVADKSTGHVIGLYRTTISKRDGFQATIPGIVDVGVEYDATVYIDANANGIYDDPSKGAGDQGWTFALTSDDKGLALAFDGNAAEGLIDVGEP